MSRRKRIALIVCACLAAVLIIAVISMDIWASTVANRVIKKSLSRIEGSEMVVHVGGVSIELLSGSLQVKDIYFATDSGSFDLSVRRKRPGIEVSIPKLRIKRISYWSLLRHHRLEIDGISLHQPKAVVLLDENNPQSCVPAFPSQPTADVQADSLHRSLSAFLQGVGVDRIRVHQASFVLKSVRTSLLAKADSLSAEVHEIQYLISEKQLTYADDRYALSADRLYARLPDGSKDFTVCNLETRDAGALKLGRTRIKDLLTSEQMAMKAQEPITWIDLTLQRVETTPFNAIQKGLRQDWTLDSVYADVQQMHVIRDTRFEPKNPFPVPQEILMAMPAVFEIKNVGARVRNINIELTMTGNNYGKLSLGNLQAHLSDVSNRAGAAWINQIHGPLGDNGSVAAQMTMFMDTAGTFECSILGKNLPLGFLNPFIRPLVGMTFESHVDTLRTHYRGDAIAANGEFMMMYHGLEVAVHREDNIPIKMIQRHGKTIENLANTLIPKSNPTAVDRGPRKYKVHWKRDEWKPYPLYIFGPCIMGAVETMLPGIYAAKQVKSDIAN